MNWQKLSQLSSILLILLMFPYENRLTMFHLFEEQRYGEEILFRTQNQCYRLSKNTSATIVRHHDTTSYELFIRAIPDGDFSHELHTNEQPPQTYGLMIEHADSATVVGQSVRIGDRPARRVLGLTILTVAELNINLLYVFITLILIVFTLYYLQVYALQTVYEFVDTRQRNSRPRAIP